MSGRLPGWLAEWLGLDAASDADGVVWQLDSAWTWAPWATLLIVLLFIAWTVVLYGREQSTAGRLYRGLLVFLRLAAFAALLVMLAQWVLAVRRTGPPPIVLVVDHSASMAIADNYDVELAAQLAQKLSDNGMTEATRLNLAKAVLTQDEGRLLAELAARYRLHVYIAAGRVQQLPVKQNTPDNLRTIAELSAEGAGSGATRLGDAVREVLGDFRGQPPAAIVLLTDGVVTAGIPLANAAEDARRKGVPITSVGLGSDRAPRDAAVADVLVDDAVFVGDLVSFQVQIRASGLEGQSARVTLRREAAAADDDWAGDAIQVAAAVEQTITLPPAGQLISTQLVDRPVAPGDAAYVVEIMPLEGEIDQQNNWQRRVVAVRDEKIRVLLASGYPSYEFRFLKTAVERDPTIELATYLQDADPDYATQDKTALRSFPLSRDELLSYDVLIIGDVDPRLLPRGIWQHVRELVIDKGGGLAMVAGPRFRSRLLGDTPPLAAILPVESAGSGGQNAERTGEWAVRPTKIGLFSPPLQLGGSSAETERIWRQLAPQYWIVEFGDLKPAAQVVATAAANGDGDRELPAVMFHYVGAGRVWLHAMDSTWLWRRGAGDTYFARYWVQTIRFLARGKLSGGRGVELTTDRREYRRGESVRIWARFLDQRLAASAERVIVALTAVGHPRREVVLRRNAAASSVFEGDISELPEGQFQALLADPQLPGHPPDASFSVTAPPGEMTRTEMDRAALAAAAETTRGKFYTIADADQLLSELPAGRRVPIENLPAIRIWNHWWLLSFFVACLTAEWILRKRVGML
jgi:hypothetical protein